MKESLQGKDNIIRKLKGQISQMHKRRSEADRIIDFKALDFQNTELTRKVSALQEKNELFRVENEKVKKHYKELYDSIKITRAKTIEKTTSLLTENEKLKAQLKGKMQCVTMPAVKPKSACPWYELLEYVIGTCPKEFSKIDKKVATTPLNRNKHVAFREICETSNNNIQTHVEQQKVHKTNVLVIPSTGVNSSTEASGSKPRSNTKNNRTLPAKSDNNKKVEDHPRNNKTNLKQNNHVDSSISSKRTWKPTGSKFTLGEQCPLTRFTKSKVVPLQQPKHNSSSEIVIIKRFSNTSQKPLTIYKHKNKQEKAISNGIPTIAETQSIHDYVQYTTVVHIVLWYLDSGCSKHMTGNHSRLKNFMKKFIGIVRFRNDHFGAIMGYGDYVIGDSVISRVYYVEGLGHDLFSVGQFYDSDLEVAFRKHSCYVRDVDSVELLKGSRGSNLYTISVEDIMKSSPICLLSKASKNKLWLWHRRLNHLNFGTINDLARKDLVRGLPRLKFEKDHLCSACQLGKSKKYIHKPKSKNTIMEVLHTLHMDLCGPMRVQSINGKKYILVIVEDYSRFTWVKFFRSKDETSDVGIFHQKSVLRTPQQNDVVERQNCTLVEAAQTMLIFSKALMFLYAKVVATAFFGALCYPPNDNKDLGKLKATADIGIFVGYAPNRKGYRIYNKRTRRIMETIHVQFDELTEHMAHVHISIGHPILLTPGQISSGLVPNPIPAAPYVPPSNKYLEILFQPMFDEYLEPPSVERHVPLAPVVQVPVVSAGTPSSKTINQDALSTSNLQSSLEVQPPISHQGVAARPTIEDNPFAQAEYNPFVNAFTLEPSSEESSSGDVSSAESNQFIQPHNHLGKWSKDHPMDNLIGNPSHPVSTRKQLATDALWCFYNSVLLKVEPKNFKTTMAEACWFKAMQEEIQEFD
ncbi:putative ribonuclease H-like domain-containing protein [Tanacetum coccineum]